MVTIKTMNPPNKLYHYIIHKKKIFPMNSSQTARIQGWENKLIWMIPWQLNILDFLKFETFPPEIRTLQTYSSVQPVTLAPIEGNTAAAWRWAVGGKRICKSYAVIAIPRPAKDWTNGGKCLTSPKPETWGEGHLSSHLPLGTPSFGTKIFGTSRRKWPYSTHWARLPPGWAGTPPPGPSMRKKQQLWIMLYQSPQDLAPWNLFPFNITDTQTCVELWTQMKTNLHHMAKYSNKRRFKNSKWSNWNSDLFGYSLRLKENV